MESARLHVPNVLHHTQQSPDKVTFTSNTYFPAKVSIFTLTHFLLLDPQSPVMSMKGVLLKTALGQD